MNNIIVNKIKTPDGTILQSRSRWDYVSYTDTLNNFNYAVDGGLEYIRRNCQGRYEELSCTCDDDIEIIRERFEWFSLDNKFYLLKDMTTEHIKNVLKLTYISDNIKKVFNKELKFRK